LLTVLSRQHALIFPLA